MTKRYRIVTAREVGPVWFFAGVEAGSPIWTYWGDEAKVYREKARALDLAKQIRRKWRVRARVEAA